MSIPAYKAVWAARDVSTCERMVLLCLADYADEYGGKCYPCVSTVVTRTGMGRSTVFRCIASLESAGHITVTRGVGDVNHYTLHPDGERVQPDEAGSRCETSGGPAARQGVPLVDGRGPGGGPDPSVEPSEIKTLRPASDQSPGSREVVPDLVVPRKVKEKRPLRGGALQRPKVRRERVDAQTPPQPPRRRMMPTLDERMEGVQEMIAKALGEV